MKKENLVANPMAEKMIEAPKPRSRTLKVFSWLAVFLVLVTVGIPVASLLLSQLLSGSIARFPSTLATVFALSGITLLGGALSFLFALIAGVLEFFYIRKRKKKLYTLLKTPSIIILMLFVATGIYLGFL